MFNEIQLILKFMRPAFSRKAAYCWFVICFFGFICRVDNYGVTSTIRALCLDPCHYTSLLHFFHSKSWKAENFMQLWWKLVFEKEGGYLVNDRSVLIGDHTSVPKDGRKMPGVLAMHEHSETSSKPSYFNGHSWGCISLVCKSIESYCSIPLYANIQDGAGRILENRKTPKTIQMVEMAQTICRATNKKAYLVLDAYFPVGPVFDQAKKVLLDGLQQMVHILVRCKKNVTGYETPKEKKGKTKGRKKVYGKKIKLFDTFESKRKNHKFKKSKAIMYNNEIVNFEYLVLDLMWKPLKGMVRFILIRSPYGNLILMTSDMNLDAVTAVGLYCKRSKIESMFNVLKNILGAMGYHFWSSYLSPNSRTPIKNSKRTHKTTNLSATANTLEAMEKFVNLSLFVLGVLQIISKKFPDEVNTKAKSWLRTKSKGAPSEFITKLAIANMIKSNLIVFAKDWITDLITQKQEKPTNGGRKTKLAG